MTPERVKRWWAKVEETDGCWLWTGAKDAMGYGLFGTAPSRCSRAHRISWELAHDAAIPEGMCVLHRCDTPSCVRPSHLFLGTRNDNMRDRNSKGRQARGERAGRAILVREQVREIRARRATGEQIKNIAAEFGVAAPTISALCHGRSWRHV